ncbi:pyridoxamine 5'-phosphate oxidase family protein [Paenibacillus sp. sptzw28]|uniref:pyridoxamine 5'-phosphate oxidase family protein n=1 Tax=Paenibacillus sp. sptzw28 TaxID=715179 RepID=UPI001C6E52D2|nr:pyridoxamine 5'-phosphate oxidase family protein [Paenibacillus sp. sptzw28]QYR19331.1 pyridoxamine 5'-phosphate oxidase family protein [Paenibacillus sp. sptzw28]
MKLIRGNRSFDLDEFLKEPLFAHLSTMSDEGPRDSPVWYLWEKTQLWIIGTSADSFPNRILKNPKCAIGIVDFNRNTGKVLHVGFRGAASVRPYDKDIAMRLLSRYLGPNMEDWDSRFRGLSDSNLLISFTPETVVVRDQSYKVGSS